MTKSAILRKSISIGIAIVMVFCFGMFQYVGMERASALVFDLVESFGRDGGGSLPGEEFLHDAEMTINGKKVELSYSQSKENVPTVLGDFVQRLPNDYNGKIVNITDTGGVVAYRDDQSFTLISAAWDAPTGTSLITRAHSDVEADETMKIPEQIFAQVKAILGDENPGKKYRDSIDNSHGDFQTIFNTALQMIEEHPNSSELYSLINEVNSARRLVDVPGFDLKDIPRHPDCVRNLCMEQETETGGRMVVLNYTALTDMATTDNFFFFGMKSSGWESSQVFEAQAVSQPLSKRYMFTQEDKNCTIVLSSDLDSTQTKISIIYLDKII